MSSARTADAVVVGGGLAGLTAAALLAGAGRRTVLVERSSALGGRARTMNVDGFHLNLGPHAWYVGGPGTRVLESLGVPLVGSPPRPAATFAIADGRLHPMPIGFISLLTTDLLSAHGKFEAARTLASIAAMNPHEYDGMSVSRWLDSVRDTRAREVIGMLIRIAAYTDAPGLLSAGVGLYALQSVIRKGVRYLDGGWEEIVDALAARAVERGVEILTGTPALQLRHDGHAVQGVEVEGGEVILAPQVVLAVEPAIVQRLAGEESPAAAWKLWPSRAAVLDVALRRYPNPKVIAAFGVDRPLYFAVHSASARLAPAGGAVIHAAKYLDPERTTDPEEDERELEGLMDRLQPGWRAEVVHRRYLPKMTVTHAVPHAAGGGFGSRPAVDGLGLRGAWLAGDWVGTEGTLGNAAVSSAALAARRILAEDTARGDLSHGRAPEPMKEEAVA